MGSYRTVVTFCRRRQKYFLLLLIFIFLYSMIQSFGEVRNTVRLKMENEEFEKQRSGEKYNEKGNANFKLKTQVFSGQNTKILPATSFSKKSAGEREKVNVHSSAINSVQPDDLEQCEQSYPTEANTEFNTFDIFQQQVATKQLTNETVRSKRGPSKLTVFFLPMTHVDPGWLRTFNSYTNDTNSILNNLHAFMISHSKMRFMWCEIVFFEHWWRTVNESVKSDIRKMISNGQFEIASGSWVMTDEANPYFPISVDNIIEGQQFVLHELNVTPSVIWSNDPFGYGPTEPYLFSKTGVRYAVINRIHHQIKNYLQSKKAVPFLWRQHFDSKGSSDVLTQVLPYTHYDILNSCGPDASVCCQFDFKRITHFFCGGSRLEPITKNNVVTKAAILERQLQLMSEMYESNVLLVMWGDDFRYDMIEEWYQQYDNLMPLFDQINSRGKTEVRFGTFADYFGTLERFYKAEATSPATLSGDFFPYRCALGDYWTGYYTTRPFFKRLGRMLHAMIHAADLATLNAGTAMKVEEKLAASMNLTYARRNLALFQHHDAITGTSKKHVMKNYGELLYNSLHVAASIVAQAVDAITGSKFEIDGLPLQYDKLPTKTLLRLNPGQKITVAVWNSLTRARKSLVTLRVSTANVIVKKGEEDILAQIEPYFDSNAANYTDEFQLVFLVDLEPLSANLYVIEYKSTPRSTVLSEIFIVSPSETIAMVTNKQFSKSFVTKTIKPEKLAISTSRLKTTHDIRTGLLESLETGSTSNIKIVQTLNQYKESDGGAYIMRISGSANPLNLEKLSRYVIKGPIRQTVVVHAEIVYQRTSALVVDDVDGDMLHIDMRVDVRQLSNVQLITRFNTSLDPVSTQAFSDSNGMQLIKRKHHSSLAQAANYYPMPTAFVLQDADRRISIVSDLEHGAAVLGNTGAEIMLDRILLRDDGKGLGTGEDSIPDDMVPVQIGFTIVAEDLVDNAKLPKHFAYHSLAAHQALQNRLYQPVLLTSKETSAKISTRVLPNFPCDVQLISARFLPGDMNKRILILHRLGTDCSLITKLSCSTANLNTSLNQYLKSFNARKVQWTNLSGTKKNQEIDLKDLSVELQPMDFASLIVSIL